MLSVIDSHLYRDMFATGEMRAIFDERQFLARCIETEVALAQAQARLGIIPQDAAACIAKRCHGVELDMARMGEETERVGYPILALVHQLAERCGEAGRWLHWGATTQDIMDTATVLQIRDGVTLVKGMLDEARTTLAAMARAHRDTPMAGRTHLQHALPITFGYKVAAWLSALDRHAARVAEVRPRVLVVQFGGAAGTLASLGESAGLEVRAAMAELLDLGDPPITWHAMRDAVAETVQLLALIGGTLGKIALDVMLMCSTEFGELAEPFVKGRGASSTMPQKRNPISCELILAASKSLRAHAGLMLDAMVHDFERATGPWHLEWRAVPESFAEIAGALRQACFMLAGLEVDRERMRRNLDLTGGLISAEAVMMALAPHTGRQAAHDLVYDACRTAFETRRDALAVMLTTPAIVTPLGESRLRALLDPMAYVGAAPLMVDRLLAARAEDRA